MVKKEQNGKGKGFDAFFEYDDLELDFDLEDFAFGVDDDEYGEPQGRIMQPRIDFESVTHKLAFSNAREFAKQIDLSPNARTYAWVDGTFVFGDILEALLIERYMVPEEIYISSLSISQENIDSLKTILLTGTVKKLYMLLSAYFYSHEKTGLVPYMYSELDIGNILQVAFINSHTKIIAVKTVSGNTLTIHGSANLRSSNSIEQLMAERDPEFYEFNARIIGELVEKYGTINHSKPKEALYRRKDYKHVRRQELWRAVVRSGQNSEQKQGEQTQAQR